MTASCSASTLYRKVFSAPHSTADICLLCLFYSEGLLPQSSDLFVKMTYSPRFPYYLYFNSEGHVIKPAVAVGGCDLLGNQVFSS